MQLGVAADRPSQTLADPNKEPGSWLFAAKLPFGSQKTNFRFAVMFHQTWGCRLGDEDGEMQKLGGMQGMVRCKGWWDVRT